MARVTVEDCLEKVPNRFALVHLATKRARQLMKDAEPLLESENKECVTALREVADGRIRFEENIDDVLSGRIHVSEKKRRGGRRRR